MQSWTCSLSFPREVRVCSWAVDAVYPSFEGIDLTLSFLRTKREEAARIHRRTIVLKTPVVLP